MILMMGPLRRPDWTLTMRLPDVRSNGPKIAGYMARNQMVRSGPPISVSCVSGPLKKDLNEQLIYTLG